MNFTWLFLDDYVKWIKLDIIGSYYVMFTGQSFSEALILASTNPQYDKRLFIALQVQYMKIPCSEHVVYMNCSECQNKKKTI